MPLTASISSPSCNSCDFSAAPPRTIRPMITASPSLRIVTPSGSLDFSNSIIIGSCDRMVFLMFFWFSSSRSTGDWSTLICCYLEWKYQKWKYSPTDYLLYVWVSVEKSKIFTLKILSLAIFWCIINSKVSFGANTVESFAGIRSTSVAIESWASSSASIEHDDCKLQNSKASGEFESANNWTHYERRRKLLIQIENIALVIRDELRSMRPTYLSCQFFCIVSCGLSGFSLLEHCTSRL